MHGCELNKTDEKLLEHGCCINNTYKQNTVVVMTVWHLHLLGRKLLYCVRIEHISVNAFKRREENNQELR